MDQTHTLNPTLNPVDPLPCDPIIILGFKEKLNNSGKKLKTRDKNSRLEKHSLSKTRPKKSVGTT